MWCQNHWSPVLNANEKQLKKENNIRILFCALSRWILPLVYMSTGGCIVFQVFLHEYFKMNEHEGAM